MKKWRDLGYVRDSDDEDEDLSVDSQTREEYQSSTASTPLSIPPRDERTEEECVEPEVLDTRVGEKFAISEEDREDSKELELVETAGDERRHGNSGEDEDEVDELQMDQLPPVRRTQAFRWRAPPPLNMAGSILRMPESESPNVAGQEDEVALSVESPNANDEVEARHRDDLTPSRHLQDASSVHVVTLHEPPIELCSDHDVQEEDGRGHRSFRQRKAIQLHPYAIEMQKYREILQSRGIRPIRLPSQSQHREQHENHRDSSSPSSRSASPTSPRNHSHSNSETSFPSSPPTQAINTTLDNDEDLPQLSTLFHRSWTSTKVQSSNKRRKIQQTYSCSPRTSLLSPIVAPRKLVNSEQPIGDAGNIFYAPPSPPRSDFHTPTVPTKRGMNGFRYPPGFSPTRVPTPEPSSNTGLRTDQESLDLKELASQVGRTETPQRTVHFPEKSPEVDVESDSSDTRSDSSEEFRGIQKRIKGVLPASWLKLDLKKRGLDRKPKRASPKRPPAQRNSEEPHAGVAQRRLKTTHRSDSPPSPVPIVLFDDSESISGSELQPFGVTPIFSNAAADYWRNIPFQDTRSRLDEDPGDRMEDDTIDNMAPSAKRAHHRRSMQGRKHQLNLKDAFQNPTKRMKTGHASSVQRFMTPKGRDRSTGPKPGASYIRQPKPPRLSILDAPAQKSQNASMVPQFLKIAVRQARRHPEKARQSPIRKQIRLQTRQDTEEATSVLRDWFSGNIRPCSQTWSLPATSRPPLAEISTNKPHFRRDVSFHFPDSVTGIHKPKSHQISTHLRQTKLQPVMLQKSSDARKANKQKALPQPRTASTRSRNQPTFYEPAQLETAELGFVVQNDRLRFEQGLRRAARDFHPHRARISHRNPLLAAFIDESRVDEAISNAKTPFSHAPKLRQNVTTQPTDVLRQPREELIPVMRKPRKRQPQQIDIETREYRQPDEFVLPTLRHSVSVETLGEVVPTLLDLGPFGTQFTRDFDIFPLAPGTYFHESTFIGSGDFRRAIAMDHRDLDVETVKRTVLLDGRSCVWSNWEEDMGTTVHEALTLATRNLEGCDLGDGNESMLLGHLTGILSLLRQFLNANAGSLTFFDPIDRGFCVSNFFDALEPLQKVITERMDGLQPGTMISTVERLFMQALSLHTALARQLLSISQHPSVSSEVQQRAISTMNSLSVAIYRALVKGGFEDVRTFFEENRRHAVRESGIRNDKPAVEAFVILWHVLDVPFTGRRSFWEVFNADITSRASVLNRLGHLERCWQDLYTVLPLLEINISGISQVGRRFQTAQGNWEVVKVLLSRTLTLYQATAAAPGSNINKYVRTLLARCHDLIQRWAWRECEPIIGIIFDFFAQNKLAPLEHEETRGSPRFLELLDQEPSLEVSDNDNAFQIFLKIVGTGLRGMRGIYTDKKIQSIAWRCIPNHGRIYRKEQNLNENDLAALRNHHDLLITLYWASPLGFGPRILLFQSLVDHANSHREACRLNIKAWTNLVKFQMSVRGPVEQLDSFIPWFQDIVEQTIGQYRVAQSEVEAAYEKARQEGNNFSTGNVKKTISRNQNQVIASLLDTLAGLKSAVASSKDQFAAAHLLQGSGVERVFGLYDAKKTQTNAAIIEVLRIYTTFVALRKTQWNKVDSQPVNEDSQDYGDWPEELDLDDNIDSPRIAPVDFIFQPLMQFLSNCFGSETVPDDNLLTAVVSTWTAIALSTIQAGEKEWAGFLDNYSAYSWHQLRDTEQTRKYGPYFLSLIVEADPKALLSSRDLFYSAWLMSLVERESQLKFQHRLTTALLRTARHERLLHNLPFTTIARSQIVEVTMTQLRERRLALLSSVFLNMRDHFNEVIRTKPKAVQEVRAEYATFLKQLMATMKKNFLELQQGSEDATGAYVVFVQSVVEFLQQYTSDICPVDTFFTDSNVFPLPSKDPTYVVGRLKGYGAKLGDMKVVKQLASFFQNVSSRAAADNQQSYLIEQLQSAMSKTYETTVSGRPTLRSMLIQGIFPSYIEASLTTSAGWILAKPILHACARMFEELVFDFSATDEASVEAVVQLISTMLSVLQQTVSHLAIHPESMQHPHILQTLTAMLMVVTAIMPNLNHIKRRTGLGKHAFSSIAYFKKFTVFAAMTVVGHDDAIPPLDYEGAPPPQPAFSEIRSFCERELQQDLNPQGLHRFKKWTKEGEQYFVLIGSKKEVIVDLDTIDGERDALIKAVEEFHNVLFRMDGLL